MPWATGVTLDARELGTSGQPSPDRTHTHGAGTQKQGPYTSEGLALQAEKHGAARHGGIFCPNKETEAAGGTVTHAEPRAPAAGDEADVQTVRRHHFPVLLTHPVGMGLK